MVSAAQRHSMKVTDDKEFLRQLHLNDVLTTCVHGTVRKKWPSVKTGGLVYPRLSNSTGKITGTHPLHFALWTPHFTL